MTALVTVSTVASYVLGEWSVSMTQGLWLCLQQSATSSRVRRSTQTTCSVFPTTNVNWRILFVTALVTVSIVDDVYQ